MEMTRQRMRSSAQGTHYTELPPHMGRGWVRKPESLATEALRELALILSYDKVKKAELVVPGRVAGELLSSRRRSITRMELITQKTVLVRVSDALGTERFNVYAYDEAGNDIDITLLPKPRAPKELPEWTNTGDDRAWDEISEEEDLLQAIEDVADPHPIELDAARTPADTDEDEDDQQSGGKKKRRRRRGGRGRGKSSESSDDSGDNTEAEAETKSAAKPVGKSDSDTEPKPEPKATGRRKSKPRSKAKADTPPPTVEVVAETPAPKKPRLLYAGSRRKLKPSEKASLSDE